MSQIREFKEVGIGAEVKLLTTKDTIVELEVNENDVLVIPQGLKAKGFFLSLLIPAEARGVIAQKNVRQEKGGYHRHALVKLSDGEIAVWVMNDYIIVERKYGNVWTNWHDVKPNRLDWIPLDKGGKIAFFLVGVVTHDNGKTFRLLGEYRWRGRLYLAESGIIAKPDSPTWGPFPETRRGIFEDEEFKKLLADTVLSSWDGTPEELIPPFDQIPGSGFARIQWFSPFGGQTGQGIAILHDGSAAWVHGVDILDPPDPDGIQRLWYNQLISYKGEPVSWGTKKDGLPKLLCVKVQ